MVSGGGQIMGCWEKIEGGHFKCKKKNEEEEPPQMLGQAQQQRLCACARVRVRVCVFKHLCASGQTWFFFDNSFNQQRLIG